MPVWTDRSTCRVCDGDLDVVLSLGEQYLPRWIPQDDVEELKPKLPRAPLRLARCSLCGLLQLHESIEPDLVYRKYWYRSGINTSMQTALLNLVRDAGGWHGSGKWLDIGANDGTLLRFVPRTFERLACEPAYDFEKELADVADYVMPDYFHADERFKDLDIITSAAMFYDVDEPDAFVREVQRALSKNGVWINQLNDATAMIQANAWDGICHEHNLYYDLPNLEVLYRRHGLKILRVSHNDVNGGSMRVTAGREDHPCKSLPCSDPLLTPSAKQVLRFCQRTVRWKLRMREVAKGLPRPIYGYGASTKGGTLMQYLDVPDLFVGVADRNPLKHGTVQSGIWAPIVSEEDMRSRYPGTLFVLPWAFRDEFIEREEKMRAQGAMMVFPLPNIELVS